MDQVSGPRAPGGLHTMHRRWESDWVPEGVKHRDIHNMAYSGLAVEVRFVPALWHLSRVSHLAERDLERVCGNFGLSSADINVLGALWNSEAGKLRATDLADMLRVSNAVLSPRVAKLARKGLLEKEPSATDRRATEICLTRQGTETIESAFKAISVEMNFVRYFAELPDQDQKSLIRILNKLHDKMLRDYSPRSRGK